MNKTPLNNFDRSKPFYPLVMSYLIQLHGLKELMVRGLLGPRDATKELEAKDVFKNISPVDTKKVADIKNNISKLLGPLELRSEFQNSLIRADADEICIELLNNHNYLLPFYVRAAGFLFVLAHECTKYKDYRDTGALWEFLRHCRNAVGHNGLFHFERDEPKRPAKWGSFTLAKKLQGTPLFKNEKGNGMLSPGDPIRLLWDIEQAYPDMTV